MVSASVSSTSFVTGTPKRSRQPQASDKGSDAKSDSSTEVSEYSLYETLDAEGFKYNIGKIDSVVMDNTEEEEGVEVAGFRVSPTKSLASKISRKMKWNKESSTSTKSLQTSNPTPAVDTTEQPEESANIARSEPEGFRQQPPQEELEAATTTTKETTRSRMSPRKSLNKPKFLKKTFKKFKSKSAAAAAPGGAASASVSEGELASVVSASASSASQFTDTRSIIDSPQRNLQASFVSDGGTLASSVMVEEDEQNDVDTETETETEGGSTTTGFDDTTASRSVSVATKPAIIQRVQQKSRRRYAKRVKPNLFPPAEVLRRLGSVKRGRSGPKRLRLYVDDFSDKQFKDLLRFLESNKTLFKVQIQRLREDDHARVRTDAEMDRLLDLICDLPQLEHLCVANVDPVDVQPLTKYLKRHETLLEMKAHVSSGILPPEFLQSLATVVELAFVEIDAGESFDVSPVMRSTTLETLRVVSDSYTFEAKDVLFLKQELERNTTLKTLYLEPHLTPFTMRILAYALRANRTLEGLHFSISGEKNPDETAEAITDLLLVFELNPQLHALWNHNHGKCAIHADTREQWLEALEENKNITEFHVFDEDEEFFQAKDKVLRRNRIGDKQPQSSWFCFPAAILYDEEEEEDDIDDDGVTVTTYG